ncbi:MAG TPA: M20 family metallopeptidase [Candidatus Nanopelagicales bacterium]|nr:M20 family metallopeptidase [Candidatus Nanopelagicales bacterium]
MPTPFADLVPAAELDALRSRIGTAEPAFLADLERLVNLDCGSYTRDGVNEVATWTATFLERLGGEVIRHPDPDGVLGDTVEAVFRGEPGGPRALLIGHTDTVFPEGTAAARPYRVDDGIAKGPGVTDMKSGLLTLLYGLEAALAAGPLPFERLTVIANPDEEIGSPASTTHIERVAYASDVAFSLECARANGDIVSSRKGTGDYVITVNGRAAHAGVEPEKGRSAILAAAHLVIGLHGLNGRWPGVTCNVGVIEGGIRPNVVAERAVLHVDLRAVDRAAMEAADAAIRELAAAPAVPDVTIDVDLRHRHWPMEKLPRSGRLIELTQELAADLGFAVRDAATGGASDANTTAGLGVPSLDGLGPIGGMDHSPEEWLDVSSIVPRTTLFAALLLATGRDPEVRSWRAGAAG